LEKLNKQLDQLKLENTEFYSREILDFIEAGHMVRTAKTIVAAAIMRKESRGAHFTTDHSTLGSETNHTFVKMDSGIMNCYQRRLML